MPGAGRLLPLRQPQACAALSHSALNPRSTFKEQHQKLCVGAAQSGMYRPVPVHVCAEREGCEHAAGPRPALHGRLRRGQIQEPARCGTRAAQVSPGGPGLPCCRWPFALPAIAWHPCFSLTVGSGSAPCKGSLVALSVRTPQQKLQHCSICVQLGLDLWLLGVVAGKWEAQEAAVGAALAAPLHLSAAAQARRPKPCHCFASEEGRDEGTLRVTHWSSCNPWH